jgi:hypothetical protein
MFDALDFRKSGIFIFNGIAPDIHRVQFNPSSFPDWLINLSLTRFEWIVMPIRPRSLRHLTKLNLDSTYIEGTLGEYLDLPNLKSLTLWEVTFKGPVCINIQDRNWTRLFSDTRFLRSAPLLEIIELRGQDIDENFADGLEACTLLKTLYLYDCEVSPFISPFLEQLQSNEFVPSLEAFSITSWPINPTITFEDFAQRFVTQRPNINASTTEQDDY